MKRLLGEQRPTFTFGVVLANFHRSLSTIIRMYRQALPLITVRMLEIKSLEQVDALREGRSDAGISRVEIEAGGIRRRVMRHEPMVAAPWWRHCPATTRSRCRMRRCTLSDCKDAPGTPSPLPDDTGGGGDQPGSPPNSLPSPAQSDGLTSSKMT
ncbi:LysR substrate-binding domain-containing protein [Xanthomonas populi]